MIGNSIFCYGNISMTSSHSSRGAWHTVSGGGGGGGGGGGRHLLCKCGNRGMPPKGVQFSESV